MNREIKLRAWINGEMKADLWACQALYFMKRKEDHHREEVLMQYTGMKDKNGVEIFEGDILESKAFVDTFIWQDGCYIFHRDSKSLPIGDHYPFEMIGNIHQNPELLKP